MKAYRVIIDKSSQIFNISISCKVNAQTGKFLQLQWLDFCQFRSYPVISLVLVSIIITILNTGIRNGVNQDQDFASIFIVIHFNYYHYLIDQFIDGHNLLHKNVNLFSSIHSNLNGDHKLKFCLRLFSIKQHR